MVEKRRIGVTLGIFIRVQTNKTDVDLSFRDIVVLLTGPHKYNKVVNFTIEGANNNIVKFTFEGNEQKWKGLYRCEVYENKDNSSQSVFDIDVVELVEKSSMEQDGTDDLAFPEIELSGNLLIGGKDGKSAYEIAVDYGFRGTIREWLDSLKPVKGVDYFTDEDIESIKHEIESEIVVDIDWATDSDVDEICV